MFTIYRFNDFELNRLAEFISGPAGPFSLPPALRPSTNAKSIRHCPLFQSKASAESVFLVVTLPWARIDCSPWIQVICQFTLGSKKMKNIIKKYRQLIYPKEASVKTPPLQHKSTENRLIYKNFYQFSWTNPIALQLQAIPNSNVYQ